jgi:hypothetical protein
MLGFMLNWLRNRQKAALREEPERRLTAGALSQPGDFIECTCGERWEFDPAHPDETSFPLRWNQYLDHVRVMHPDA